MIGDSQFAQLLLKTDLIDRQDLDEALELKQRHGGTLYTVVLENGLVNEERAITEVAHVLNIPCVSLKNFDAERGVTELLEGKLAAQHRVVPLGLSEDGQALYLAMANPLDVEAMDEVSARTGFDVVAFLAGPLDIDQTLERCYGQHINQWRPMLSVLFEPDDIDDPEEIEKLIHQDEDPELPPADAFESLFDLHDQSAEPKEESSPDEPTPLLFDSAPPEDLLIEHDEEMPALYPSLDSFEELDEPLDEQDWPEPESLDEELIPAPGEGEEIVLSPDELPSPPEKSPLELADTLPAQEPLADQQEDNSNSSQPPGRLGGFISKLPTSRGMQRVQLDDLENGFNQSSVRLLNREADESPLIPDLLEADTRDLLLATLRLLIKRGVLSNTDILAELGRLHDEQDIHDDDA